MELTPRLTPWVQKLVFTGRSFYTIDVLSGGKITAQRDVWDAIQDNNHLSLEGLAYLIRQLTSGQVRHFADFCVGVLCLHSASLSDALIVLMR